MNNFDYDEDDIYLRKRKQKEKPPLWDSFQDPPPKKATGSAASWNKLTLLLQVFKVLVYILVFGIVLGSAVISKLSYLLMVAQIPSGSKVKYCDIRHPKRELYARIPDEQQIAWIWALIFAFSAPEVFTFFRSLRICVFKDVKAPTWLEVYLVVGMELLHVVGLAVFTFVALPAMDSCKALMVTNAVCLVPAILCFLGGPKCYWKSIIKSSLSLLALFCQVTALIIWPAIDNKLAIQILSLPLLLISLRWWENYIDRFSFIAYLTKTIRRTKSRYNTYLFLSPLKCILFALSAFVLDGRKFTTYFTEFLTGLSLHDISINQSSAIYSDVHQSRPTSLSSSSTTTTTLLPLTSTLMTPSSSSSLEDEFVVQSNSYVIVYTLIIQIVSSYLCYIFAKFACKVKIQEFSFSMSVSVVGPVSLAVLVIVASAREADVCAFHDYIPDYLAFRSLPIYRFSEYLEKDFVWLGLLWWASQLWVTYHIWYPRNDKNAPTEKLFVCPWYCGLLVEQCITMNRRRIDWNEECATLKNDTFTPVAPVNIDSDILPQDTIPQLIICATMWHETQEEMMEFLKSIVRLDEDQCAHRMAKIHINKGKEDEEYYELETNIFFDDAFELESKYCQDPKNPPLNEFVKLLIESIEKACFEVYGVPMKLKPPMKIETPYGGRLVWTLPGRTKMIAHLKNKDKIRHKKRWSQVMYMYYLLGFRIMELENASPRRKTVIAENTFILALDGDIDFQPQAVQLLIDRMKAIDELGAACGRIHPVGRGPMVWYQKFEYAIGHWLQKSTEHVIGCVLCSPGCFSLFRGSALMENSVMKKYTTVSQEPMHYVQYDQGEDRWLCTLILKQGMRVEYSAASDAYTHSPENFNEFYNQRRRWVPSTIANIYDLLSDADMVVKNNSSISMPYIGYQFMLLVGTVLGPGTIFLMMIGALVSVFSIDIWTAFLWNFFPLLVFVLACLYLKQKYQLLIAFVVSTVYCLVMMAVLIGIIIQMLEDGIFSPATLFFIIVAGQIVIAGLMHPQEAGALWCGFIYYITIPSMYMLLLIYSIFNMNDVSWGTREKKSENDGQAKSDEAAKQSNDVKVNKFQQMFAFLKPTNQEEGSFDFSCAGLFRCMFCTHPKSNAVENQLMVVISNLAELNSKIDVLEDKVVKESNMENKVTEKEDHTEAITLDQNSDTEIDLDYMPGWVNDPLLVDSPIGEIPLAEKRFWRELIKNYLKPMFHTKEKKDQIAASLRELRNMFAFAFVMINSLFVLIVTLLQIKKEYLHVQWPVSPKDFISYDETHLQVYVYRQYQELDPIGLCFVVFFGLILIIQFIAMFFHRFATVSQLLAATKLDWLVSSSKSEDDALQEIRGNAVNISRQLQRPKRMDDDENENENDDDNDDEEGGTSRRQTICKLHEHREKHQQDYSDLVKNFESRFYGEDELKVKNISMSRKSIMLLNETRDEAKRRKTEQMKRSQIFNLNGGYDNEAFDTPF
ncbi:chitin synthase chs-2 [Episyrphus balteatus]|uniref:chitin synthase chs-2 n=1 Tax=Episyrphus balteatus TaxID=286459 RepID=UPI002485C379|nr:chitin synthase chs-2 [Episyrphus balteatus]